MFEKLRKSTPGVLWWLSFFNGWERFGSPVPGTGLNLGIFSVLYFWAQIKREVFKLLPLRVGNYWVRWPQTLVLLENIFWFLAGISPGVLWASMKPFWVSLPPWLLQCVAVLERLKFKFKFMHCCCLRCCYGQKSCTEFAGFWGSFSREISSKGFFFRLGFENLVGSGWADHVLEKIVGERKRLKWVGFCSSASASKSQVIECWIVRKMACVKLGSKSDAFQRQGQAW